MFGGEDEDGDFLSPTGGAKLACLFGLDQESSQGNESFQYTAPKQPRKTTTQAGESQKQPAGPAVLLASAVQAFKYINGQYMKQGKLGAAVLGNHATKEYKFLLYLSQQKQVTAARIHVGFIFTVQLNNYCTFYDDQRQNWSLMFDSEKNVSDFCKEVCLAKANSSSSLESVVTQDVILGEGQAVETGDSMEVVYTGWLLQNHAIGQMFDSNQNKDKLLRLKIGAGKVIKGWEEGMLGMKKAGRRLIIIPPTLAYGAKGVPNRVPPNSTLIFEVELRRVKFSKDSASDQASSSSRESAAPSPAPSPAPSVESLISEPSSASGKPGEPLRAKSNSLTEQLGNPDATKAKLISRMAKMGQPMLPFLTGAAGQPESSDSELEDTSISRVKDGPAVPPPGPFTAAAPASAHAHLLPHTAPSSALLPVIPSVGPYPGLPASSHAFQTSAAPSQMQAVGQVYAPQTVPYMGSGELTNFLMTEARQHNTEIRLSIGKVADKVDQLASKISDLEKQGTQSVGVSGMTMETSMIVHNISRIVQENESLKKEMFEKSSRIEEQNRKIGDLINQNQKYMEQSHQLLEQRNDSLKSSSEHNQARLLQAEQDKQRARPLDRGSGQVRLTEELASSTARVSQLQLEASAHQQKASKLQGELSSALEDRESRCQRIAALEAQLEELKEAAERVQNQYRSEKQRRKEMELRVGAVEEELQDLKSDKENLGRALAERKKKWQAERQHRDEEVEELRRSSQQELDSLRAQLRKARTCSDSAASEQLSQLQAELEEEWRKKSEQMLAVAREQHRRELSEVAESREALQDQLTRLQEKHSALERHGGAVKEQLERQVADLERTVEEQQSSKDTAAEVKRVMNGVFHSLRAEFDLSESYSGQAVLGVIVTTIKNVTLQLLSGADPSSLKPDNKEEDDKGGEGEDGKQLEHRSHVHVNGEQEVKEEETVVEEHVADADHHQDNETQMVQKVKPEPVSTSEMSSQAEDSETLDTPDLHLASSAEPASQRPEPEPAEPAVQQHQEQPAASESCTKESEVNQCVGADTRPGESPLPEEEEEAAGSSEVEDVDQVRETPAAPPKAFGPPTNPPPPPTAEQNSSADDTSLTGGSGQENREESFFQTTPHAKPPASANEEEEEDDMSLKGRPPPAPLFGEDDEDDDLDWLS
ncbi:FK506-binding protein 15 isoform X3 [Xiphophorus couchianus]|uniref:FK506-binding protein 15 isoform X3 n=1 Tax=Xiphophorus couchianus TaxID=32473 RepID=UPI001015F35D|nr:FK506-binding protein 15 isoform X3 [Xiphophorus couchianus]